jgi:hypothetical protein
MALFKSDIKDYALIVHEVCGEILFTITLPWRLFIEYMNDTAYFRNWLKKIEELEEFDK